MLGRLEPIERAIMETPARTVAGLGVKARHTAYVMSEYWDAPIDKIDWDARAVRLLMKRCAKVPAYPCRFVVTTRRRQPQTGRFLCKGSKPDQACRHTKHRSGSKPAARRQSRDARSARDGLRQSAM
jgi:hypothetical protein